MVHKILLVEDEEFVRSYICHAINSTSEFEIVGEAGSVSEGKRLLVNSLISNSLPSIVLVDLGLPDGSGISLIEWLQTEAPSVKPLVLSSYGDEEHVVSAITAGASGYLLKTEPAHTLVDNINAVVKGESPLSSGIANHILRSFRARVPRQKEKPDGAQVKDVPQLTSTESEVLQYIAKGLTVREIAKLTNRSPHTVPVHVKNIYKKLAVHSRGEAVYEAVQLGMIGET